MDKKSDYTVYFLSSENKKDIFYVGVSQRPDLRIKTHLSGAIKNKTPNALKNEIILKLGEKLEIHELSKIYGTRFDARKEERKWIHFYLKSGHKLVNVNGVKNEFCSELKLTTITINKEVLISLKSHLNNDRKIAKFVEAALKEKIEKETKTKKKNA